MFTVLEDENAFEISKMVENHNFPNCSDQYFCDVSIYGGLQAFSGYQTANGRSHREC
jgi:hypothetical protein